MDKPPEWVRWAYKQAHALNSSLLEVSQQPSQSSPATPAVLKFLGLKRVPLKRK